MAMHVFFVWLNADISNNDMVECRKEGCFCIEKCFLVCIYSECKRCLAWSSKIAIQVLACSFSLSSFNFHVSLLNKKKKKSLGFICWTKICWILGYCSGQDEGGIPRKNRTTRMPGLFLSLLYVDFIFSNLPVMNYVAYFTKRN
jgi:hypothetical protein